ncbi:hypothetical protein [Streptomyces sp. NPDC057617]|uniref:hypothetical protein n=1 Tax=Streptomyces sp. NPDC057617 TaxID=3346184 RepID=UPI0036BCFE54
MVALFLAQSAPVRADGGCGHAMPIAVEDPDEILGGRALKEVPLERFSLAFA